MSNEEFVDLMNEDLMREYNHLHTYLQFGVLIQGFHRQELSEYFLEEAASELKHCEEFARMIVGLGGIPNNPQNMNIPNYLNKQNDLLSYILKMEKEVVGIFAERMKQAESLQEPDASVLHVFYENQIMDSHKTVNNVMEMLK